MLYVVPLLLSRVGLQVAKTSVMLTIYLQWFMPKQENFTECTISLLILIF